MRVLIAGGRGMLGGAFARLLNASGHEVRVLTRGPARRTDEVQWDGSGPGGWEKALRESDAVVNACGYGLQHWPWSTAIKRRFIQSRVGPGRALATAIGRSDRRPGIFIQFSGINRYGLHGATVADECTPAADDFLAQLTVEWERATAPLQDLGVRHVLVRNAVVLHRKQGLFPLMALPAKLFAGGRFGSGAQTVPWIHAADHARALLHLLEDPYASGAYNLIAPQSSTNSEFMQAICGALGRPFWLHMPDLALRLALGEMAQLVLSGRPSRPKRLLEAGFVFAYPTLESALGEILRGSSYPLTGAGEMPT
jgi:hypothetical protein